MDHLVKKTYNLEDFTLEEKVNPYFETAYGFVCFENVSKIGIGIGGAQGVGDVYVRKTAVSEPTETSTSTSTKVIKNTSFQLLGELTMTQYSIGPQLGGKVYSQIIFFHSKNDFNNFVNNNSNESKKDNKVYEFGVDANIVALEASAGANVSTIGNETVSARVNGTDHKYEFSLNKALTYNKGLAVFTITVGGLMLETCFSGQEYKYEPATTSSSQQRKNIRQKNNNRDGNEDGDGKNRSTSSSTTADAFADHVENLQKFAKSMKNSFVEKTGEDVENLQKFAKSMKKSFVGKTGVDNKNNGDGNIGKTETGTTKPVWIAPTEPDENRSAAQVY